MKFQKYIVESRFVFNYEKVDNITPKFFSDEFYPELLKSFDEPNTIQLPPGLPDEIPVIVAKSKGNHSDLNVSPIVTTLSTKYNDGYENDINLCLSNLTSKFNPIFNIISNVLKKVDKKFLFCGLTFAVELCVLESNCSTLNLIFDKLTKFEIDPGLDLKNELADFNFKIALSKEDYYININIGRAQNDSQNRIIAIIDVNNKYAFLKNSNYDMTIENIIRLFNLSINTVNSIESILNGRLCLDE